MSFINLFINPHGIPKKDCLHFQGISLGKSANAFEAALRFRGWEPSLKVFRLGDKIYEGKYDGYKSLLAVSYNSITRAIVWVMVCFEEEFIIDAEETHKLNIKEIQENYRISPKQVSSHQPEMNQEYDFYLKYGIITCCLIRFRPFYYSPSILYIDEPNNDKYINF